MSDNVSSTSFRTARATIRLSGTSALADELGSFGESVVGRDVRGAGQARTSQEEDFALRRLIVAWRLLGRLELPLTIHATQHGSPDFVIETDGKPVRLGVEHTNAGSEPHQRWLTQTAKQGDESSVERYSTEGYVGSEVINQVTAEIRAAIDRKVGMLYDWPDVQQRHLLVYLNTDAVTFRNDIDEIVRCVRTERQVADSASASFDEVHLIIGETVIVDVFGQAVRVDVADAYEIDIARWTRAQSNALRSNAVNDLDLLNIAEELESMGRRDQRALRSQLRRLQMHLLKWQAQPEKRSGSWRSSIREARTSIDEILSDSPSLRRLLEPFAKEEFPRARVAAADETDLPVERFPELCPFDVEEIMSDDFLPESRI